MAWKSKVKPLGLTKASLGSSLVYKVCLRIRRHIELALNMYELVQIPNNSLVTVVCFLSLFLKKVSEAELTISSLK